MPVSGVINLVDAYAWLALALSDNLHHTKATDSPRRPRIL
jgi:hypothetical protein